MLHAFVRWPFVDDDFFLIPKSKVRIYRMNSFAGLSFRRNINLNSYRSTTENVKNENLTFHDFKEFTIFRVHKFSR